MKNQLHEFYLSKESDFQNLIETLVKEDLYSSSSHPQLMGLWPNEPLPKVMFIGQEPYTWEAKEEESIRGLIYEYLNFDLGSHYNSPFWSWVWWMSHELGLTGKHPFLYNNINKIGDSAGGPARPRITEIENTLFNLFRDELNIVKPDVCIFLTGPNYDNEIKNKLPNAVIKPIDGFSDRELAIVEHECLPKDSYRTYHPKYGNFNQELYYKCFSRIKQLIRENNILNTISL